MEEVVERIDYLELRIHQIRIQLQGLEVAISQLMRLVTEPVTEPPPLKTSFYLNTIPEELISCSNI
jgi:hypothetical protein